MMLSCGRREEKGEERGDEVGDRGLSLSPFEKKNGRQKTFVSPPKLTCMMTFFRQNSTLYVWRRRWSMR
jgi:hypothetical protein